MNLIDTARRVAMLLQSRGRGHTSLMQEGVNNFRGDVIVLAHNQATANSLVHFRKQTRDMYRTFAFGVEELGRTYGIRAAVAIDHHAIAGLLDKLCSELNSMHKAAEEAYWDYNYLMGTYEQQDRKVAKLMRINADLKDALREYAAKPAITDPVLVEALVRGVAEEGSVGSGRLAR